MINRFDWWECPGRTKKSHSPCSQHSFSPCKPTAVDTYFFLPVRRAAVSQLPDACPKIMALLVELSNPLAAALEHYLCHRPFDLRFRWVLEESEALDSSPVPRTLLVPVREHPICVQYKRTASDLEVRTSQKAKGYRK
jgi:hypothetical protein